MGMRVALVLGSWLSRRRFLVLERFGAVWRRSYDAAERLEALGETAAQGFQDPSPEQHALIVIK